MTRAAKALPLKRMRELEARLDAAEQTVIIGMEIHEVKGTGRRIRVGGVWSTRARRYIAPLPSDWKPRRHFTVGPNQYAVLLDFATAMQNDHRVEMALPILQDIVIHGGRRSGKSSVMAPAGSMALIMFPGSLGLIMGPLKRHGDRILAMIRRVLDPEMWTYDKREFKFRLVNTASATSRNAGNYNNEVGDGLRWLLLEEARNLPEVVYERLSPGLYDNNGVCCMTTTPKGHDWIYRKSMQAKNGSLAIRDHTFPLTDNVFLSDAAKRRAIEGAETLSKSAYQEEILGEYVLDDDVAFSDFSDENIRHGGEIETDVTAELCRRVWGSPFSFIAAVDFNFSPTIGCVVKFDALGRPWILREISVSGGATDRWGEALAQTLRDLGSTDPVNDCMIVADASGEYQGTGKNAAFDPGVWKTLLAQGWNIDSPTGEYRKNPKRFDRVEIIRSLVCNASGRRRLFVDPECPETIDMFRSLPLRNGIPDKKSRHIHTYDGATYGIYRIWGTMAGETYYNFKLVQRLGEKEENK